MYCTALLAKKTDELLDRDARLSDQRAQGSLCNLSMIRNGQPPIGRLSMAKDDVAALLSIDFVPEATEGGDCFTT